MSAAAQIDAFGPPRLLTDTPRSRSSDPQSSHIAAEAIKASGQLASQQQIVLTAVQEYPGLTSAELAARMNASRPMVARRLPELVPVHVTKGPMRLCSVVGSPCLTWWPR